MLQRKWTVAATILCFCSALFAQQTSTQQTSTNQKHTVPAGTEIKVRTDEQITADAKNAGQSYTGKVTQAVTDSAGNILIPKGATAELKTVADGSKVAVDLASVTIDNKKYA